MRVRVYIFGIDEGEQEIDDESIIGKLLQGRYVDGFEAINAMAVDVNDAHNATSTALVEAAEAKLQRLSEEE